MKATLSLAVALSASLFATTVHAEEETLYLGQKNHFRVDLGSSIFMESGSDAFGLSPILSGRYAISDAYGLTLQLPLSWLSVSDESHFKLANPTIAFELVDDAREAKRAVIRAGVALPVASVSDDDFSDALLDALTLITAASGRGMIDLWLWWPESLGIFAEFHTTAFLVDMYADLRFSIAGLIPTGEGDFELVIQSVMRFGFDGGVVIPFAGLSIWWMPTTDDDAFQSGLQLGAIFNLGGPSIDLALQVNLDDPAGFSFDDGILGVHLGATVPF
ncbi:MAG: hypothetical protein IT385_30180 [Deltaproteobacteria bacterium]|nr:hypothetical protein [Deltaproteobacteria bacterium]